MPEMKAHNASLLNALILVSISIWAFFSIEKTSYTALIPAAFGLALMGCYPGLKANRFTAHLVAAGLTIMIILALYVPLSSSLEEPFSVGLFRIFAMIAASLFSLLLLLKFFFHEKSRK